MKNEPINVVSNEQAQVTKQNHDSYISGNNIEPFIQFEQSNGYVYLNYIDNKTRSYEFASGFVGASTYTG